MTTHKKFLPGLLLVLLGTVAGGTLVLGMQNSGVLQESTGSMTTDAAARDTSGAGAAVDSRMQEAIRQYIRENPEEIFSALEEHRRAEMQAQARKTEEAITEVAAQFSKKGGVQPVVGNPDGDITVVQFFDYLCGYCKRAYTTIDETMQADPNVRLVMVELPILGPDSVLASRAALAVHAANPEQYWEYHTQVMQYQGRLSQEELRARALKLGVDASAFDRAYESADTEAHLKRNQELAMQLGVRGTPAFLIADRLVPGMISAQDMLAIVKDRRRVRGEKAE